jgi:hypothetical protein
LLSAAGPTLTSALLRAGPNRNRQRYDSQRECKL